MRTKIFNHFTNKVTTEAKTIFLYHIVNSPYGTDLSSQCSVSAHCKSNWLKLVSIALELTVNTIARRETLVKGCKVREFFNPTPPKNKKINSL